MNSLMPDLWLRSYFQPSTQAPFKNMLNRYQASKPNRFPEIYHVTIMTPILPKSPRSAQDNNTAVLRTDIDFSPPPMTSSKHDKVIVSEYMCSMYALQEVKRKRVLY